MNTSYFSILVVALFCLAGCAAHNRDLEAPRHPVITGGLVWDMFETDLRPLLAARERKHVVLYKFRGQRVQQVPDEAYLDTFYLTFDGQPTGIPSATRAQWKREFRSSAATYTVMAEDNNVIILYFDVSERLRQYVHVPY